MYVNKSLIMVITIYLIHLEHVYFSFICFTPSDDFDKFNGILRSEFFYSMDLLCP